MNDLRNAVIRKEILGDKIIDIAKRILNFNNQEKSNGLKIVTPKQMIQRLPIALARVKVGNTSENLLNEIRQIIHSLYQAKKITKKVYNNIMDSIKVYNNIMNSINLKYLGQRGMKI